ncbi:hypothetical protein AMTR_s02650p00000630 [Amborella trichopoda]|uniref:Uncharacterized protein n=1 Tax=Amborella trichopoda TaxID=13333 RepID=U5CXI8_AMBTC|nr:hypothetical protein AMTR_s02650p00000630 [Amborella trichopoda]
MGDPRGAFCTKLWNASKTRLGSRMEGRLFVPKFGDFRKELLLECHDTLMGRSPRNASPHQYK